MRLDNKKALALRAETAMVANSDRRVPGMLRRGPALQIVLDGRPIAAYEGESVAAALIAAGVRRFCTTATNDPRGPYCGMGVCFDCVMEIDGQPGVRSCQTPAAAGMQVRTQEGFGRWGKT
jgi:predicted molibdopterin-dependent oxidoreductase YjgC